VSSGVCPVLVVGPECYGRHKEFNSPRFGLSRIYLDDKRRTHSISTIRYAETALSYLDVVFIFQAIFS
jgi:hypothetical protein